MTLQKSENREPSGTLQKPENRDPRSWRDPRKTGKPKPYYYYNNYFFIIINLFSVDFHIDEYDNTI